METDKCWQVFYIENCHDCGKYNQEKFMVAVFSEIRQEMWTNTLHWSGFYINTFGQNLENLKACDLLIERAHHNFLKYDSWVNVNKIHSYPDSLLDVRVGAIASQYRPRILHAVELCPTLKIKDKKRILTLSEILLQ